MNSAKEQEAKNNVSSFSIHKNIYVLNTKKASTKNMIKDTLIV